MEMLRTRRKTREVLIGHVGVGGENPLRIQSMTTTNTNDISETVDQIMRLADCGCEIARVTVQGIKEANSCELIKTALVSKGYRIPLVADIHFYPPAALRACEFVDKVRINPGNFVDKRAQFQLVKQDQAQYSGELARIKEKFGALIEKCKALKKPIRIGVNHGSLSDRIMTRYGDTPKGMVASALEFAEVCKELDFHDFLFSMKSSNPLVMVAAYRLLVQEVDERGWMTPMHLGVTEAGSGVEGRVKSAIGIGALLLDGIGDTIRVSLTEDPEREIDPCLRIKSFFEESLSKPYVPPEEPMLFKTFKKNSFCDTPGGACLSTSSKDADTRIDCPESIPLLQDLVRKQSFGRVDTPDSIALNEKSLPFLSALSEFQGAVLFARPQKNRVSFVRQLQSALKKGGLDPQLILHFSYKEAKEECVIKAAMEAGSLLLEGIGDGLFLEGDDPEFFTELSFTLLQATRRRLVKTDFISCPSCGRTLFDLQEVTEKIKERTAHLPGVKIAIMGCIVNGPGEMNDAHFGYVGSAKGKVDLYVGHKKVKPGIDAEHAKEELVALIKEKGMWVDPLPKP